MPSDKFVTLIHYICWRSEDGELGATKLNKVAWLADAWTFLKTGKSLTGETYVKQRFGPVPKHILPVIEQLKRKKDIAVKEPTEPFMNREFFAPNPPDMSAFTDEERQRIDHAIAFCRGYSAWGISCATHELLPWQVAALGEEIPMYAYLASTPGNITKDDKVWGNKVVKRVSKTDHATA